MVDRNKKVAHTYRMLTSKESGAKAQGTTGPAWDDVLKFASENQRLEGFPGEISEAAKQHRPNMDELVAVSKQFGAQVPGAVPSKKD
jgi:hypothetical protein